MDINLYRYNKNYYVLDGRLPNNILEIISLFETINIEKKVIIDNVEIVTPLIAFLRRDIESLIKYFELVKLDINLILNDNIEHCIYYGNENDKAKLDAIFYYIDKNGTYIYIGSNLENVKKVIHNPVFNFNKIDIDILNIEKLELYIEDVISSTYIEIDEQHLDLFNSKDEYLDLYKIMNRLSIKK